MTPGRRKSENRNASAKGFNHNSHSGSPKQRTPPVYCFGKKHSYSLGENKVLPPPTYTRPFERDGPAHMGPRAISFSTAPLAASRATSLPLPTVVKYTTPLPTAIPEPTMSPTSRYMGSPGVPPTSGIFGRSCRQRSRERSSEVAVTRPPVGNCLRAKGLSWVPERKLSIPLQKIVCPSVAQPVCNPPIGLGSASTRGS